MANNNATALALERVLGLTTLHNSTLSSHLSSGEVAYAAGCVVVLYHPKRNKQTRYFRAAKPIASISFSHHGDFLAVGERGPKPTLIIWDVKSGQVVSELKGHRYGVDSLAWSPDSSFLVSIGFKMDKQILLWYNKNASLTTTSTPTSSQTSKQIQMPSIDMVQCGKAKVNHRIYAVCFNPEGTSFVTCGEKHVKWWSVQSLPVLPLLPPSPLATQAVQTALDSTPNLLPPPPPSSDTNEEVSSSSSSSTHLNPMIIDLKGKIANIIESQRGSCFIDIACGLHGKCFALSSKGILCSFDEKLGSLTSFVSLEAPNGYCISLQQVEPSYLNNDNNNNEKNAYENETKNKNHTRVLIAVGCSNGLVRIFNSNDLRYLVTLPQPPPVGYLNFNSVNELTQLTMAHNMASDQYHTNLNQYDKEIQKHKDKDNQEQEEEQLNKEDDLNPSLLRPQKPPILQYPACVALRWLNKSQVVSQRTQGAQSAPHHLSPPTLSSSSSQEPSSQTSPQKNHSPPTHLVAIYGDRSLFVWDVSKQQQHDIPSSSTSNQPSQLDQTIRDHPPIQQEELTIGKYRSFQNHSSCIWDICPMPQSYGNGHGSMFFSCAADNTVRWWSLDSNNLHRSGGGGGGDSHNETGNTSTSQSGNTITTSNRSCFNNFFSKELVHVFNCDELKNDIEEEIKQISTPKGIVQDVNGETLLNITSSSSSEPSSTALSFYETYQLSEPCTMGGTVFIEGELDVYTPCRVDHPLQKACPRVMAISPNGDEVACGDRIGNLRVWSIKQTSSQIIHNLIQNIHHVSSNPSIPSSSIHNNDDLSVNVSKNGLFDLIFAATAHDAEILSLDYTFQNEINCELKAMNHPSSLPPTTPQTNPTIKDSNSWRPLLLASGGRDCLIHILGASEQRNHCSIQNNDNHDTSSVGSYQRSTKYELLQTLEQHESTVTSLKFSPDGRKLFSIGAEGTLCLAKVNPLDHHHTQPSSTTTSPTSNKKQTTDRIHRYKHIPLVNGVSYDVGNDITGKYIVCAGQNDCKLHIYSSSSGKHLRSYSADPNDNDDDDVSKKQNNTKKKKKSVASELYKLDLCPAGMYLATCSFDQWIRLIDFYSGQVIAQVSGHAELVTSLRFTSDGKRLISSGGDGCIFIWKLNSQITNAMNDRISELNFHKDKKKKQQKQVLNQSASLNPPTQQQQSSSSSSVAAKPVVVIDEPESPPDVREVRLPFKGALNDEHATRDSIEQDKKRHESSPSSPSSSSSSPPPALPSPNRVLQGKWAQGVAASGGGYDVLGKYHVSPPIHLQTGNTALSQDQKETEVKESIIQQTILQNEDEDILNEDNDQDNELNDINNQTLLGSTIRFDKNHDDNDDEDYRPKFMTTTRNFTDDADFNKESEIDNESKENDESKEDENDNEDELTKSVEDLDDVILGESPRALAHKQHEKNQSFRMKHHDDDGQSTTEDEGDESDDGSVEELIKINKTSQSQHQNHQIIQQVGKSNEKGEDGGEDHEGEVLSSHGDSWLGDEVRSSWNSIQIDNLLHKPIVINDVNPTNVDNSQPTVTNQNDVINSPSNSIDILSFSTTFRRSISASSKPVPQTVSKVNEVLEVVSKDNEHEKQFNHQSDGFESPPRKKDVNVLKENEEENDHNTNINLIANNLTILPSSSSSSNETRAQVGVPNLVGGGGGGFSTPSKESRRKPAPSFQTNDLAPSSSTSISSNVVGSSRASSVSSSRTLGEERERLRSRDKRRDTATALASMNDQLLKMGILKQKPTGNVSTTGTGHGVGVSTESSHVVGKTGGQSDSNQSLLFHQPSTSGSNQLQQNKNKDTNDINHNDNGIDDNVNDKPMSELSPLRSSTDDDGGYISPEEESLSSSLQSSSQDNQHQFKVVATAAGSSSLHASLATTVSGTSDEEVEVDKDDNRAGQPTSDKTNDKTPSDRNEDVESSSLKTGNDVVGNQNVDHTTASSLPRPVSEYRMSLQRLQDAVMETAKLYQELQQHIPVGGSVIDINSPLSPPHTLPSNEEAHQVISPNPPNIVTQTETTQHFVSPNSAVSPTRIPKKHQERGGRGGSGGRDNSGSNTSWGATGGEAAGLLGEFAATWESVGGFVAHSQSVASSRSMLGGGGGGYQIDSSISSLTSPSLSSDSSGSFSSFSSFHLKPFNLPLPPSSSSSSLTPNVTNNNHNNSNHSESPQHNDVNGVGLPPIFERGESTLGDQTQKNNQQNNIISSPKMTVVNEFTESSLLGSPPSRPAPPPPPSASASSSASSSSTTTTVSSPATTTQTEVNEILSPTIDNHFEDSQPRGGSGGGNTTNQNHSSSLLAGVGGLGEPSPEVSMILEKYSDVLFGMVQQKLQVSQSSASFTTKNQINDSTPSPLTDK